MRHVVICCMAEEFLHTSVFPLKSAPFQAVFSCSFCGWTHLHLRCDAWHTYERGRIEMSAQASHCFPGPLFLEKCRGTGSCHPSVGSPLQETPSCQWLRVQVCNAPRLSWGCPTALPFTREAPRLLESSLLVGSLFPFPEALCKVRSEGISRNPP